MPKDRTYSVMLGIESHFLKGFYFAFMALNENNSAVLTLKLPRVVTFFMLKDRNLSVMLGMETHFLTGFFFLVPCPRITTMSQC